MEEQVISLQEIIDAIKKRWIMIVLFTLICGLASAAVTIYVIKPKYQASTKVFIGKEETSVQDYNNNDVVMYQKLMKTYAEAIKTRDLVERALSEENIYGDEDTILSNITVVPVSDTQILQITFKSDNSRDAAKILEAISTEFIKTSKGLVPNGNVQILEKVEEPTSPVSPNKKMNIAIAALLGLMAGIGLTFLLEYMDDSFKSKEQLEKELNIPVIGEIPMEKKEKSRGKKWNVHSRKGTEVHNSRDI